MPCKFIKSKSITPILFAFSLLLPIASNAANSCSEVLTEKSDQVSQLEKEGDRFNLNHSYIAPTFNRIPPGKFVMFTHDFRGNSFPGQSIDVTLTESFHLMTTPVTQLMWAKLLVLMGNVRPDSINPSIFKNGEDSVKFRNFEDSGISMTMQPNHPVENLRAIDIELFITRLNELSRLAVPQVQKALREIIPDHKLNDVYDLPTEAQMSYVLSNLGQAPHDYFDNNGDMEKYAWMVTNSGNHTHNVATRTPRVIAGREYYDLEGNVWEMTKSHLGWGNPLIGGVNPVGEPDGQVILRGGSFAREKEFMSHSFRGVWRGEYAQKDVGFRLLRKPRFFGD